MNLGLKSVQRAAIYTFECGCIVDDYGNWCDGVIARDLKAPPMLKTAYSFLGLPREYRIRARSGSNVVRACAEHRDLLLKSTLSDEVLGDIQPPQFCERCVQPVFADDARRREIALGLEWFPR